MGNSRWDETLSAEEKEKQFAKTIETFYKTAFLVTMNTLQNISLITAGENLSRYTILTRVCTHVISVRPSDVLGRNFFPETQSTRLN